LTLQIFTWAVAAAMLGEANPFPTAFNEAMPVFAEMGQVVAEVAEIVPETPTPTPEPTPIPIVIDCPLALPSRVEVGMQVAVQADLHFRTDPKLKEDNLIFSHEPGDILEIVAGPVCTLHGKGAYLWWQVKTSKGEVGWSAEAAANTNIYFMRPVED